MKLWLINSQLKQSSVIPALLLVAVVIAVYYPSIRGGIHPYDDPGIVSRYAASLPLAEVLLPGTGYYYRPLIELSFWLDNRLWGMEPATMHLENVLLHAANSLLIFFLARTIIRDDGMPLLPLLAALLFALHPVNVEAVAWIAGRTDPLLSIFVLSSLFFWLRWLVAPRWQDMTAALLLFGAALLAKETAIAFGAVVVLFIFSWPGEATHRQRTQAAAYLTLPVVLLVCGVLFFKNGANSGLSRFLAGTDLLSGQGLTDGLVALGFYAKKLVIPLPLNFAINQVQQLYLLPGIMLFPFVWWLVRRHRPAGIFFASALLLILPAVLVALNQVAWTLFAERYLYLPSAFCMLGLAAGVSNVSSQHKKVFFLTALGLSVFFAVMCVQRILLWNDKQAFFEDAVHKSPEFGSVYYTLGGILAQKGEINRASELFLTADRLNQRDSMRYPIKAAIMGSKIINGDLSGARGYFFELFARKEHASAEFLELLFKVDTRRITQLTGTQKTMLATDIQETLELLYKKQPDPFWLYQKGQMALIAGDTSKAAESFRRAYTEAPTDAHYRAAALTYLRRLEQEK